MVPRGSLGFPVVFPFEQVEEALSDRIEVPIFVKP